MPKITNMTVVWKFSVMSVKVNIAWLCVLEIMHIIWSLICIVIIKFHFLHIDRSILEVLVGAVHSFQNILFFLQAE